MSTNRRSKRSRSRSLIRADRLKIILKSRSRMDSRGRNSLNFKTTNDKINIYFI